MNDYCLFSVAASEQVNVCQFWLISPIAFAPFYAKWWCSDNEEPKKKKKGRDPMTKVRLLLNACNNYAWRAFIPCQGLSIDESMCPYKGNFCHKQFINSKRTRFGIKLWSMCCGSTGYVLKVSVYTGGWSEFDEDDDDKDMLVSGKVVKHLVKDLSHTGNIIVIDNYYTAVAVCDALSRKGLGCIGALRLHRKAIPGKLRKANTRNFPTSQHGPPACWIRSLDQDKPYPLACVAWWDKKPIGFLSTVYSSRLIEKPVKNKNPERRLVKMPEVVLEYNYNMGGVDSSDQKRKTYAFPHQGKKWYLHMYHYMIESAVGNSHITFNDLRVHYREKVTALQFRWELIEGLFSLADMLQHSDIRDMSETPESAYTSFVSNHRRKNANDRLSGRHFVEKVEAKGFQGTRCVVCAARKKRRVTKFVCPDCGVHLCPEQCFKIFHTVENYGEVSEK